MEPIEKPLRGDDIYCTILVYDLRAPGEEARRTIPDPFGAERAWTFELRGDDWPITVDLTEFRTRALSADFAAKVSSILRALHGAGASLSWFMFDGAFDVAHIGSEWHRLNCYAVHAPALDNPVLALTEAERRGPAWIQLWEKLAAQLYGNYPTLQASEGPNRG